MSDDANAYVLRQDCLPPACERGYGRTPTSARGCTMTLPAEIAAALKGEPAAALRVLRALAEEPTVRPSVRVAARVALKHLTRPAPRRPVAHDLDEPDDDA
jgi:hypothetical protein